MSLRDSVRRGDPYVWLAGSGLGLCLLMIVGLLTVILVNGLGFFWPQPLSLVGTEEQKKRFFPRIACRRC